MIQLSHDPMIKLIQRSNDLIDPIRANKILGFLSGAAKKRQTRDVKPYQVTSVAVMQGTHGLLGVRDY